MGFDTPALQEIKFLNIVISRTMGILINVFLCWLIVNHTKEPLQPYKRILFLTIGIDFGVCFFGIGFQIVSFIFCLLLLIIMRQYKFSDGFSNWWRLFRLVRNLQPRLLSPTRAQRPRDGFHLLFRVHKCQHSTLTLHLSLPCRLS